MKAYHIMLFMLLFNVMFWVITAGIGIYNIDYNTDPNFNLSEDIDNPTDIGVGLIGIATLFDNPILNIITLSLAVAGGAMVGIFTAGQGAQGVVYGLFGYFFWSSMNNTLQVFWNLSSANVGILYVLVPFVMVVGIVFVIGLFQMVTGGFKSHE